MRKLCSHTKKGRLFREFCRSFNYTPTNLPLILDSLGENSDTYINNCTYFRGSFSVECIFILFGFKLLYPNHFFMSRGNHERYFMFGRTRSFCHFIEHQLYIAFPHLPLCSNVQCFQLAPPNNGRFLIVTIFLMKSYLQLKEKTSTHKYSKVAFVEGATFQMTGEILHENTLATLNIKNLCASFIRMLRYG